MYTALGHAYGTTMMVGALKWPRTLAIILDGLAWMRRWHSSPRSSLLRVAKTDIAWLHVLTSSYVNINIVVCEHGRMERL
jgi:hypothetical protein